MISSKILRDLSIKNKTIAIVLFVVLMVISIGFIYMGIQHISKLKSDIQSSLILNAKLIGDYCVVPLTFEDHEQATEVLSRLKLLKSVEEGLLYDKSGTVFASYPDTLRDQVIQTKKEVHLEDGNFYIREPVIFQGDTLGHLIIKANTHAITDRKKELLSTTSALLVLMIILSYFLASAAQKLITDPILELSRLTATISENHDFSVRLKPHGQDEVGMLYQQFNNMLAELQKSQAERNEAIKETTFLAHVFRSINENVTITDLNDKIIFVNQSLLHTYGYTEEELIGQHISILRAKDNPSSVIESIYPNTLKGGWEGELINIRKDGSAFPVSLRTTIIYDTEKKPVALVGVSSDITKQKHEQEELRLYRNHLEDLVKQRTLELEREKEKAQSADRLKSSFLATMSHELRTPLNSIIGFSGILLQGRPGALNDEQKKQLGMLQNSARHLLSLINDVLDISKIEAGQLKVNINQFDLPEVIHHVVEINQPLADKKNLEIKVSLDPQVGEIVSDKQRIQQVLINLVNNAIKFTDEGSVTINCYKSDDHIKIKIIDTGIGIEQDKLSLLFKPFTQVDTGLSRKHEGTGLGLSICKKLLDILNGRIHVESEYNNGSTFTVILPVQ
ncbi:MAG: PAS domain S-box protein [Bacteroidales bacterium]|nr:PAS domain S-box protein [Bacteroidales bacterium]